MTTLTRSSSSVRGYMTPAPVTVKPRQTLAEVHAVMRARRIHHLPVVDGDKLVGIVSQRDLMIIESLPGVDAAEVPVEEAMTKDVFVVSPSASLAAIAGDMADRRLGSAVVMDKERVVGVFTVTDACRALARLLPAPRRRSGVRRRPGRMR
jgi:acetoin utilization protein AcuB